MSACQKCKTERDGEWELLNGVCEGGCNRSAEEIRARLNFPPVVSGRLSTASPEWVDVQPTERTRAIHAEIVEKGRKARRVGTSKKLATVIDMGEWLGKQEGAAALDPEVEEFATMVEVFAAAFKRGFGTGGR